MTSASAALPAYQLFPENRQLKGNSNFIYFADHIFNFARGSGLGGYLDGTIIRPAPNALPAVIAAGAGAAPVVAAATVINSTTPSVAEWDLRDGRLAAIIYANVKDPRAVGLETTDPAHTMWTKLHSKFNKQTPVTQTMAQKRIEAHIFMKNGRFDTYFDTLNRLRSEANAVGCSISDGDLLSTFFASLPETCLWVIQKYVGCDYDTVSNGLVEYQLHKDLIKNKGKAPNPSPIVPTALATNTFQADARPPLICHNCKHRGHSKPRCYASGGGLEGQAPAGWIPPRPAGRFTTAAVTLDNGTSGTSTSTAAPIALSTIYELGSDFEGTTHSPVSHSVVNCLDPRYRGEAPFLDSQADSVAGNGVPYSHVLILSSNQSIAPTFLDSGASESCVRDKSYFVSYIERKAYGRMAADGDSGKFAIEGYGVARFTVKTQSGIINTFTTAALHTPSFAMNLLSIPAFDARGFVGSWGGRVMEVKHPKTGLTIVDGNLILSKGSRHLYQVNVITNTASALATGISVHAGAQSLNKPCSLAMWHNRFAHINTNVISLMKCRNLVDGLEITDGNLCGKCETYGEELGLGA
ncbi:hypothetical protein D9757_014430 [Collybiopsis confluens]|uniref:Retrovirus-related Pol polyprotein from transposon TNT 1-94-like beta-barrel domain-containing protein n=1 Tax=Collybiopsis confluens TaxID=2823264 RepID=A0A8H5GJD6_9AGAR|nr:hypothetical protein D9757_014430 [Collybiopsis confluens]